MHTYTALFDREADATAAQAELRALGIVPTDEVNISGKNAAGLSPDRSSESHGFWHSLKNVFVSNEDRPVYEEGVRQGGWLLTINVDEANADRVHDWLEGSNAVNVEERTRQYRDAGQLGNRTTDRMDSESERTMPAVGKRVTGREGVRVRGYVVENEPAAPGQSHARDTDV